jgi:hypothetical protein
MTLMMTTKIRSLLAGALALAFLAAVPFSVAHADAAHEAEEAIDEIVHLWEDGLISAEDALEAIEDLIHDVPASERTGILLDIDDVVHHWEDGDISAEDAMEQIEAIIHGRAHGDGHGHGDADASPTAAATGSAGLLGTSSSPVLALGMLAAVLLLAGSARMATARNRR